MNKEYKAHLVGVLLIGFLAGFALGKMAFVNDVESVLVSIAESDSNLIASVTMTDDEKEAAEKAKLEAEEKAEKEKKRKERAKKARLAKYEGINIFNGSETERPYLGEADAPVVITEYSDYQCPYCASFYSNTMPQILANHVKTGEAKIYFKDFPLSFHKNAGRAAIAARCAGEQDAYWYMHDILFQYQKSWASQDILDIQETLIGYAEDLELDTDEFEACLSDSKHLPEIQAEQQEGSKAGVDGTPGFTVNDEVIVGAQPYQKFQAAIGKALGKTE